MMPEEAASGEVHARVVKCALLDDAAVPEWVLEALRSGGGELVALPEAEALLVWHHPPDIGRITEALAAAPQIRWVQLPSAGVDRYGGVLTAGAPTWTCAKGVYAEPVAEHALLMALAGARDLAVRARGGRHWYHDQAVVEGQTLFDSAVTVVGGGTIGQAFVSLLQPFRASVTVVARTVREIPGAARVVERSGLRAALAEARIVLLAVPHTTETEHLITADELRVMSPTSWLINIGRGALIKQDDLVGALREGWIAGAFLDSTTPEPLPRDHELWTRDNCFITGHQLTVPSKVGLRLLMNRFAENIARFGEGRPLLGVVDVEAGY